MELSSQSYYLYFLNVGVLPYLSIVTFVVGGFLYIVVGFFALKSSAVMLFFQ